MPSKPKFPGAGHPTMEVEASWLDPETREAREPTKEKKQKAPPPMPGASKNGPPPMPVPPSHTDPPPRRQTMEVKAEWLEEIQKPADSKGRRSRTSIAAPPSTKRKPTPPIPRED